MSAVPEPTVRNLSRLGDQTTQVAQTEAEGTTAEQLQQLGSLLSEAGSRLAGGTATSAE